MRTQTRRLWPQLLAFAIALVVIDRAVHAYALRHANGLVRVEQALQSSALATPAAQTIVLSGDSDMESAIDTGEILAGLAARGVTNQRLANLALGGTDADVRFMALREYLERGGKMDTLVLGYRGTEPADDEPLRPGSYTGNNAVVFTWGRFGDLAIYHPHASFAAVDDALRFTLFRATAIGANRQALWAKVTRAEARLGMRPFGATNAYGVVAEFSKLAEAHDAPAQTTAWALGRWYRAIVSLAASHGARITFVRLPALKRSEQTYFANDESRRAYDALLEGVAGAHGGRRVDLSAEPWVGDWLIVDGLHFTNRGAALVSRAMGEALAEMR